MNNTKAAQHSLNTREGTNTYLLERHSEVSLWMREHHHQEHVIGKLEQTILAHLVKDRVWIQIADHLE